VRWSNLRALGNAEVKDWFAGFTDSSEYVHCDGSQLFFTHPEADCIDLEYPTKLERLPFFARFLATVGYDPHNFSGAMLWLTEWGVWNFADEAPGYHIIEAMNRAAGQNASFEVAPGHLFRADELTDAIAMLIQPMTFGWDAYFLPRWSYGTDEFFLHVSHDSFISIVTRTAAFHNQVFELVKQVDLSPQKCHERQKTRFLHKS